MTVSTHARRGQENFSLRQLRSRPPSPGHHSKHHHPPRRKPRSLEARPRSS